METDFQIVKYWYEFNVFFYKNLINMSPNKISCFWNFQNVCRQAVIKRIHNHGQYSNIELLNSRFELYNFHFSSIRHIKIHMCEPRKMWMNNEQWAMNNSYIYINRLN